MALSLQKERLITPHKLPYCDWASTRAQRVSTGTEHTPQVWGTGRAEAILASDMWRDAQERMRLYVGKARSDLLTETLRARRNRASVGLVMDP